MARNHLCHVATESIDTFVCPKHQDMQHLVPSGWYLRGEVFHMSVHVVDAIVEFYSLVPVVSSRIGSEAVVACYLCRVFGVWLARKIVLVCYIDE